MIIIGNIVTPKKVFKNGFIKIKGNRIKEIGAKLDLKNHNEKVLNFDDQYVLPGFIDIHIHGAKGNSFTTDNLKDINTILNYLPQIGTTTILATIPSSKKEDTIIALQTLNKFERSRCTSRIAGINLEGPFLSKKKPGAMLIENLREIDLKEIEEYISIAGSKIKLLTFAPELKGSCELISYLLKNNIIPSIGHSNATYEETKKAIDMGVVNVTHCFNAMRQFHHRDPGILGAIFNHKGLAVEIIADGIHIYPQVLEILFKVKKMENIVVVSDNTFLTGFDDGEYKKNGRPVIIRNGIARLLDGTISGSTSTLNKSVKILRSLNISYKDISLIMSYNQAKILKIDNTFGSLEVGKIADLIVFNDQLYDVSLTVINGEIVYHNCRR